MRPQRFIIAGGGTGGHIFPAIAIANALKKLAPGSEILFVGARGKMEMEKVPQAGYKIEGLTIAGYNRSSLIKNVQLPFKLVYSFLQVTQIFSRFKPTAVIGVGGYSSFPVLRFAQAKGIPTFIHESNSYAGKSNMLLGKKATRVFTAGGGMEKFFPAGKIVVTGNPVREAISLPVEKENAARYFGLDSNTLTILSVGGSLGAKSINEAIEKDLALLQEKGFQLIWQTGKAYKPALTDQQKKGTYANEFITQMELAYAAADIVISRSGAMAIAELCLVKKPVVFVPYPYAAEDHQTANAMRLVNAGAALIVKDNKAMQELVPAVIKLAGDFSLQQQLKTNIGKLGNQDADIQIAMEILNVVAK